MDNLSTTKFCFILLVCVLLASKWTPVEGCQELILSSNQSSSVSPQYGNNCYFHESFIRKGYVYRYAVLRSRYCRSYNNDFTVKFESETSEISGNYSKVIIPVPEELGEEGMVKTTFNFEKRSRHCYNIKFLHVELKKWVKNAAAVNKAVTTKVAVQDDLTNFTFTSELVKFDVDEYRVILEAPKNTRLALNLFESQAGRPSFSAYEIRDSYSYIDTEGEEVDVSIYDGSSPYSSMLYKFGINYTTPEAKWVFSSGNVMTFSFTTDNSTVYVPEELFKTNIYVLRTPLDCMFELEKNRCQWIEDRSNKSIFTSPEMQTEHPLCVSLTYNVNLNATDAFFVTWETDNSSSTLYRRRGFVEVQYRVQIRFQIPGQSKGKIRMWLKNDSKKAKVTPTYIKVRNGSCYDAEKFKHLDCRFSQTMCEWKRRTNGAGVRFVNDVLVLRSGGKIVSPKMAVGNHCLELQISGERSRLLVYVLNGGVKTEFRKGYAVNFNSPEKRRIILRDVAENSKIILASKVLMTTRSYHSSLSIYETILLPMEQCLGLGSATRNPKVEFARMGNGVYAIDSPILTPSKVEFSSRTLSKNELGKWVCFRYRFHRIPTLSTCLKMKVKTSRVTKTAWTQCMDTPEFKLGCFPLTTIIRDNFEENIKIIAVIKTSNKATTTNTEGWTNTTLNMTAEAISRPYEIFNTVFISEPLTNITPGDPMMSINWQVIQNGGLFMWSRDKHEENFGFYPILQGDNNFGEEQNYLITDPFESNYSNKESIFVSLKANVNRPYKINLGLHLFEYGQSEPISSRRFLVNSWDYIEIKHEFKLIGIGSRRTNNNYYQIGLSLDLLDQINLNFRYNPYYINYFGYVRNLTVGKVTENVNCTFDFNFCGWDLEDRDEYSYPSISKNKMQPYFDSKFGNIINENAGYVTLLNTNNNETVQEWISAKSPALTATGKNSTCILFSYYVNGNDDYGNVTLSLNLEMPDSKIKGGSIKKVELWSLRGNQGPDWFEVQLPIPIAPTLIQLLNGEEFRLEFEVSKEGTLGEYFVAVDSVSLDERSDCESYDHLVDPDF